MAKTISSKSTETKKKIKDAFISLYDRRRIESISVQEITDLAGYKRGTFYIHYEDIYSLLEEIEEELMANLNNINKKFEKFPLLQYKYDIPVPCFTETFEFIKDNSSYFKTLLGKNGDSLFRYRMKQTIIRHAFGKLENDKIEYKDAGCASSFMADGLIGLVFYWLNKCNEISSEEISLIALNLMYKCYYNFDK